MGNYVDPKICVENGSPERGQELARDNGTMSIGDLAREFGVSLRTLRFYQSKGLLAPERRGKARQFSPADCQRLALILRGKRLGFTLTEMRAMLAAWQP